MFGGWHHRSVTPLLNTSPTCWIRGPNAEYVTPTRPFERKKTSGLTWPWGRLNCREGTIILELDQGQLSLPGLLVNQVVIVLGWDVEGVSFLGIELSGVENDSDLSLQHHKHHGVLVGATHPLGRVSLDPEEWQEVIRRSESSSILDCVWCHTIPLLPNINPSMIIIGCKTLDHHLSLVSATQLTNLCWPAGTPAARAALTAVLILSVLGNLLLCHQQCPLIVLWIVLQHP